MKAEAVATGIRGRGIAALVATLGVLACCAGSASAACAPGSKGPIAPSADTYAYKQEPGTNFGAAYGWVAGNTTTGFNKTFYDQLMHGYVRYSLPTIPAGCSLNKATMRI